MNRKPFPGKQLIVATGLALASCVALADDSSMSVLTGDSYAYFNGLEYRAGQFNVARAKTAAAEDVAMKAGNTGVDVRMPMMLADRPLPGARVAPRSGAGEPPRANAPQSARDRAAQPSRVRVPGPFRDDTGA